MFDLHNYITTGCPAILSPCLCLICAPWCFQKKRKKQLRHFFSNVTVLHSGPPFVSGGCVQTDSCLSLFSSAELHFSTLFSFLLLNTEHLFFEKKNSTRFCLCLCQAPSPSSSFYSERKQNWSAPPPHFNNSGGFSLFFSL